MKVIKNLLSDLIAYFIFADTIFNCQVYLLITLSKSLVAL
ncbi:hypothetical protein GXM_05982 [Nostoc sphaeroides CCNUC1]|uniref:Uncharacterized protein n=1 Tax=Nostoc sphaeroides CCNUC1 TaxID=2653204 RepID=A0A5P8W6X9_9NOSO|nr:hypothetical protein GXM_05982 [Nostoc sphaeroides CCNUC1]